MHVCYRSGGYCFAAGPVPKQFLLKIGGQAYDFCAASRKMAQLWLSSLQQMIGEGNDSSNNAASQKRIRRRSSGHRKSSSCSINKFHAPTTAVSTATATATATTTATATMGDQADNKNENAHTNNTNIATTSRVCHTPSQPERSRIGRRVSSSRRRSGPRSGNTGTGNGTETGTKRKLRPESDADADGARKVGPTLTSDENLDSNLC